MIKIGSYKLNTRILLAPLSGVSDLPFRLIAREYGAKFCFFEMIDSNSLIRGNFKKVLALLKTDKLDNPVAAQLVGEDPDMMFKAAKKLLTVVNTPFIDINAACPVKKIIKKGAGSALLLKPDNLFAIIEKLTSLSVPVTVKLRTGFEKPDIEALLKIAAGCESRGAAGIFIHGRTRSQGYAGDIDYESIRAVKNAVRVPVIASGNIFDEHLAKAMFEKTACDGIAVARGALGNPWIFERIEELMTTGRILPDTGASEKREVLLRHLDYIWRYNELPPLRKVGYMRKFVMWYLKGLPMAARMREHVTSTKTYDEMLSLVKAIDSSVIASTDEVGVKQSQI